MRVEMTTLYLFALLLSIFVLPMKALLFDCRKITIIFFLHLTVYFSCFLENQNVITACAEFCSGTDCELYKCKVLLNNKVACRCQHCRGYVPCRNQECNGK